MCWVDIVIPIVSSIIGGLLTLGGVFLSIKHSDKTIQKERLELAKEIEKTFNPDYYILSGGLANVTPGKTEAEAMYDYLVNDGSINKEKLTDADIVIDSSFLLKEKYILIQKGKKNYFLIIAK